MGESDPGLFTIACKSCSADLASGRNIVKIKHHHVVADNNNKDDEGIRERITLQEIPEDKKRSFLEEDYVNDVFCKNCASRVGNELNFKIDCSLQGYQIMLSRDALRLKKGGIVLPNKFQWKTLPFYVREVVLPRKPKDSNDFCL